MPTTAVSSKLIKKIKDDRFDSESLHDYTLLIQLGVRDLQVGILHGDRLIFFEDYIFNGLNSYAELLDVLRGLVESHEVLMAGFWKGVVVSIKNNHLVQVPAALFEPSGAAEYLRFNARWDSTEEVFYCEHKLADVVTVFSMPQALHRWIVELYPKCPVTFVHQSAALIEGVLQAAKGSRENPIYIYVDRFKLHVLSVKDDKLVYYNQFVIKQFSDYVKYIMLVMNGLNMDQNTSQVIMWGYIGKNSPHYHEFYKYIRNVVFGGRPTHLRFGYMFDEVQDHHFFDLYSTHLLRRE